MSGNLSYGQPGATLQSWQFSDEEFDRLRAEERDANTLNPDLRAFRRHGGKLILYHGWADQAISPFGTPAYHQAVEDTMGGAGAVQHFARLFMIPTMYPKRARYTGSGSIDDAASFVAADPATPPDDHVKWLGSDLMRPGGGRR